MVKNIAIAAVVALSLPLVAQTSTDEKTSNPPVVVLSGTATTARILDPNSKIVLSGYVMRVADFGELVSANTEAVQHLRTLEKHSREKDQPAPPSTIDHSK